MSIHTNIHHSQQQTQVVVRDHRGTARPTVKVTKPVVVRDHRGDSDDRDRDRDRDRDGDRYRPVVVEEQPVVYQPSWSEPSYVAPTYTVQPAAVQVQGSTGLVSELALNNLSAELAGKSTLSFDSTGAGSTYLGSIYVIYTNGSEQTIAANVMLNPSNPCYRLPIGNGGDIARIVVDGHSDWNGSIAITAR